MGLNHELAEALLFPPAISQPYLSVVMPCHNEVAGIEGVIRSWHAYLRQEVETFEIIVINDGSSDGTGRILDQLRRELRHIRVIHQLNLGHEMAVRRGYENARGTYVLQVDSCGRYEPEEFTKMWNNRLYYTAILGRRTHRRDSFTRRALSRSLGICIQHLFGIPLRDANIPFRLYERSALLSELKKLPSHCKAVNLALAIRLKQSSPTEILETPIPHKIREYRKSAPGFFGLVYRSRTLLVELIRLRLATPSPT